MRSVVALVGMLGMLGALAPGARAQVVLDQSHVITHTTKGLQALTCMDALAQTFTALRDAPAGASATLNAVEVFLVPNDTAPAADITVQIRNVDPATGAPSSGVLATALIPRTSIPLVGGFVRATFTAPATVVAGTRYAIVLSTSECRLAYGWEYDPNNFYGGDRRSRRALRLGPGPRKTASTRLARPFPALRTSSSALL